MKFNFAAVLKNLEGKPVKATDEPNSPDFTLQACCVIALQAGNPDERNFAKSAAMWDLAFRIRSAPINCEVSSEEVTIIKNAIGRVYGPPICGPANQLLEGGAVVPDKGK